jgi:hypothetical protein
MSSWGRGIWRHYLTTDVGFVVEKAFYVPEKALWKLKVSWVNLGVCHEPLPMNITQSIEIPKAKLDEWVSTHGKQVKASWGEF